LRFDAESDPIAVPAGCALDLRRFAIAPAAQSSSWSHDVRSLDSSHRVVVGELALPPSARRCDVCVVAAINGSSWVLRRDRAGSVDAIAVDRRGRVTVPPGVRHLLGINRLVGVSVSTDAHRIAMWSVQLLDSLAEGG
jgi:hypothetical protein